MLHLILSLMVYYKGFMLKMENGMSAINFIDLCIWHFEVKYVAQHVFGLKLICFINVIIWFYWGVLISFFYDGTALLYWWLRSQLQIKKNFNKVKVFFDDTCVSTKYAKKLWSFVRSNINHFEEWVWFLIHRICTSLHAR